MTGETLTQAWSFTADELAALALREPRSGATAVLGLRPRHTTVDAREAALSHAAQALTRRAIIVDGVVEPEIATVLHALQRPDRELAMRLVTPAGIGRFLVVRHGSLCVTARRVGDQLDIAVLGTNIALSDATATLLGSLPAAHAAPIEPVGAPLSDLTDALSDSHDPQTLADRIRALGAPQRAAVTLGAALGSRQAFAEIVYRVVVDGDDLITRVPAAVGVFYTARGRVIGVPSVSPAGQLWSTLKPGSDQVFGQAVSQLAALSTERWEGG
jgi:hypothetical protein